MRCLIGRELPAWPGVARRLRSSSSVTASSATRCPSSIRRARHCRPEYAQLAFGDVQPAFRVSACNGAPDRFCQSPGFARSKRFAEGRRRTGIQVIHDQYDLLRSLVFFIQEVSQREGPIHTSPPFRYSDMPLATKRFDKHEDVVFGHDVILFGLIQQPWKDSTQCDSLEFNVKIADHLDFDSKTSFAWPALPPALIERVDRPDASE